jgi:hypothetical protein
VPRTFRMQLGLLAAGALAAATVPVGAAAAAHLPGRARPAAVIPPPPPPDPGGGDGTRPDPVPVLKHTRAVPRAGSPWRALMHHPSFNPGAMIQLTDGTVLVQNQGPQNNGTNKWWRLKPTAAGSYVNGTWSQAAALPSTYAPLYFASALLPDGRVIIEGGEYNHGNLVWTNRGAIYDPVANTWTMVAHPAGSEWARIGDGPSTVLAGGKFMLGASGFSGTTAEAVLNAQSLGGQDRGAAGQDGPPRRRGSRGSGRAVGLCLAEAQLHQSPEPLHAGRARRAAREALLRGRRGALAGAGPPVMVGAQQQLVSHGSSRVSQGIGGSGSRWMSLQEYRPCRGGYLIGAARPFAPRTTTSDGAVAGTPCR